MQQRLQKCISEAGVASRRAGGDDDLRRPCDREWSDRAARAQADPETDVICIDGRPLPSRAPKRYIMLNKPRGYVTTMHDERGRKTVADLVASAGERLYPVGRLDLDSEGLLILTNDGEIANCLMHPSHEIPKTYEVDVEGGDLAAAAETCTPSQSWRAIASARRRVTVLAPRGACPSRSMKGATARCAACARLRGCASGGSCAWRRGSCVSARLRHASGVR